EKLERLARGQGQESIGEQALVKSPGAMVPAWAVKVTGVVEYNVYDVQQISILEAGVPPATIGSSDLQAVNLAESFMSTGAVASGTFTVMWRVGDKYVIYVKP
ncbi:MAG: hypothetical protein GY869_30770, partial [Planctomycetes bacterium]|nr:hypothetical protein [Planctomycetota bacterium]